MVAWYAREEAQPICKLVISVNSYLSKSSVSSSIFHQLYLSMSYFSAPRLTLRCSLSVLPFVLQWATFLYLTNLFCVSPTPRESMYRLCAWRKRHSIWAVLIVSTCVFHSFEFHCQMNNAPVFHYQQSFTVIWTVLLWVSIDGVPLSKEVCKKKRRAVCLSSDLCNIPNTFPASYSHSILLLRTVPCS